MLKNRIVMSPMTTKMTTEDGSVTKALTDYYVERTRGGTGLIGVEAAYVNPQCRIVPNQLSIGEDDKIPSLRKLTDTIKRT